MCSSRHGTVHAEGRSLLGAGHEFGVSVPVHVRGGEALGVVSLGRAPGKGEAAAVVLVEGEGAVLPEDEVLKKEITEFITKYLSRKERLIVVLYYFEDLTMREIGAALDLSESRVCQLHSRIVSRLRNQLSKYQRDLVRE